MNKYFFKILTKLYFISTLVMGFFNHLYKELKMTSLQERIRNEMTSDYTSALEKNFELAKEFVLVTPTGRVEVKNKNLYSGQELIQLYLIGKCYSKEANYSESHGATNDELIEELGKSEGSIFPWLKKLRDNKLIKQIKNSSPVEHYIPINLIESTLLKIKENNP